MWNEIKWQHKKSNCQKSNRSNVYGNQFDLHIIVYQWSAVNKIKHLKRCCTRQNTWLNHLIIVCFEIVLNLSLLGNSYVVSTVADNCCNCV